MNPLTAQFWCWLAAAFFGCLAIFAGFGADYFGRKASQQDKTIQVQLKEPRPFLKGALEKHKSRLDEQFIIRFGMFSFVTRYNDLSEGFNLRKLFDFGFDYPMKIKIVDGRLLVTAWFNDRKGNMIARIVDNEWEINPDNYFDRNFDNDSLEVIDKDKIPVLQVHIVDGNRILVGGVFYFPDTRLVMPFDGRSHMSKKPAQYDMETLKERMMPMFKYPSEKNIGVKTQEIIWDGKAQGVIMVQDLGDNSHPKR